MAAAGDERTPAADATAAEARASTTARTTPWTVAYADGSANAYRFWQTSADGAAQFEFTPVTPERSSSGTYSGGTPKAGTLDAEAIEALWAQVDALMGNPELHTEARAMGTGSFTVTQGGDEVRFLVVAGEPLAKFDVLLSRYRGE